MRIGDSLSLPTEGETSTYLPANLDLAARALILVIENALDLSPEGQAVEIQAKNENDKIEIYISDRGPGIPEALKDQIFEPFVQGDSTRTHQGLGIGEHVVRRIMRAHGGTRGAQKVGCGTNIRSQLSGSASPHISRRVGGGLVQRISRSHRR